jgi:hypothetical protein
VLSEILKNVVGFDLNPLAVMAARANFLIALGDLLREPPETGITIPVYLADSILVERKTVLSVGGRRDMYLISTEVEDFAIPTSIVTGGRFDQILAMIAECVSSRDYTDAEFKARLQREFPAVDSDDAASLVELFRKLSRLESENKNKIWLRLLRNSCAPLLAGKFNFVVGNPPWIGWGELPEKYRERMRPVWQHAQLIPSKLRPSSATGGKAAMGRARKELATLFIAVSLERYLADDSQEPADRSVLAFLLPFTTFKAPAEGEFRTMLANKTEIRRIHDLVTLRPFKRATNRTAMIVLSKGVGRRQDAIPVTLWKMKKHEENKPEDTLGEVKKKSIRKSMIFVPVQRNNFASPWMELSKGTTGILAKLLGRSEYSASAGVYTALNGVFFVDVL